MRYLVFPQTLIFRFPFVSLHSAEQRNVQVESKTCQRNPNRFKQQAVFQWSDQSKTSYLISRFHTQEGLWNVGRLHCVFVLVCFTQLLLREYLAPSSATP